MLTNINLEKQKITMPIKAEEGFIISETGNWNVAADYSKLKIMKPLYLCDSYENIARYGYDSLTEQIYGQNNNNLDSLKLKGFERLVNELIKLIGNSKFAMKYGNTLKKLNEYEEKLKVIRGSMGVLYREVSKQKGKTLVLNQEKYYKVLDLVCDIKASLNEPLNKNHLIFTNKEEFDPKAYKKKVFEDATTRG